MASLAHLDELPRRRARRQHLLAVRRVVHLARVAGAADDAPAAEDAEDPGEDAAVLVRRPVAAGGAPRRDAGAGLTSRRAARSCRPGRRVVKWSRCAKRRVCHTRSTRRLPQCKLPDHLIVKPRIARVLFCKSGCAVRADVFRCSCASVAGPSFHAQMHAAFADFFV